MSGPRSGVAVGYIDKQQQQDGLAHRLVEAAVQSDVFRFETLSIAARIAAHRYRRLMRPRKGAFGRSVRRALRSAPKSPAA